MNKKNNSNKKSNPKKKFNIVLSILLVIGILSASFGTYSVVFSKSTNTNNTVKTSNSGSKPDTSETQSANADYAQLDIGKHTNELAVNDSVKMISRKNVKKISKALISVKNTNSEHMGNDDYSHGDELMFTFKGNQEAVLGDLQPGDIALFNGDTSTAFSKPYFFKIESIYAGDEQTEMYVSQPLPEEVFDTMDIGVNDILSKDNLVSYATAEGIDMHFGDISEEIKNVSYTEPLSTTGLPEAKADALGTADNSKTKIISTESTDYSTEPTDLIIDFNLKHKSKEKNENESDEEESKFSATGDIKLTGKLGIEDLSAYMVCDMPSVGNFKEVFFGVRGKTVVGMGLDASFKASYEQEKTSLKYDGILIDAELSGIDKKWLPLGIWQFTGNTLLHISSSTFEKVNVAPTIFVMLYMDANGEIKVDANFNFTFEREFNNGLSVFKDGKLKMNVMSYPYSAADMPEDSNKFEPKWNFEASVEGEANLTLAGLSVQFYFAGINLGEIRIIELGVEGKAKFSVTADSKEGIKTSNDTGDTELYLRGYLKMLGLSAKINAEVEAFQHELSADFDLAFQIIDITLFKLGVMPEDYKHSQPVSSQPVPAKFESAVCIVGDVSGSMNDSIETGETKVEALRSAAHIITDLVRKSAPNYNGEYGLGVVQFASQAKTIGLVHNDYDYIDQCIDYMEDGGGTDISAGIEYGIDALEGLIANSKTIILMTDGEDGNHDGIIKMAQNAKSKGIVIYTIGFGDSVDDELLENVANVTGGEYRASSTDTIVSLIGSFMFAYESSQADVLVDVQGAVSQGDTVEVSDFEVPDETGDLSAKLFWPGSVLDIVLVDPNNRTVNEEYPGVKIEKSAIPASITVTNPLSGKWKYKVKGVETSYDQEPFYAISSFKKVSRQATDPNPKLDKIHIFGAFCLPIGVFMIIVSTVLLITTNKRKKDGEEQY